MDDFTQRATTRFGAGYNCAQATFAAFAAEHGLEPAQALKIAAAFGGGMGRRGEVCGAVTGTLMALGLALASDSAEKEQKEANVARAQEFLRRFEARFGSLRCRDLLGYDPGDASQAEAARLAGTKPDCTVFVAGATDILREMIAAEK